MSEILQGVRRPHRSLFTYYFLESLLAGPFFVLVLPFRYFRYRTLRYSFDPDGLTVRWGILFRREVSLNYARIQDIHLTSNLVERWLGLGRVQIQTASGDSAAEVTIEGLHDFEAIRNALYQRMRGAVRSEAQLDGTPSAGGEVVRALEAATAELRALREELGRQAGSR